MQSQPNFEKIQAVSSARIFEKLNWLVCSPAGKGEHVWESGGQLGDHHPLHALFSTGVSEYIVGLALKFFDPQQILFHNVWDPKRGFRRELLIVEKC